MWAGQLSGLNKGGWEKEGKRGLQGEQGERGEQENTGKTL